MARVHNRTGLEGTEQTLAVTAPFCAAGRTTPTGTRLPASNREVFPDGPVRVQRQGGRAILHFHGVSAEDLAEILARVNHEDR